jgi:hypothetical protein
MKRVMSVADLLAAYPHLGVPQDSFSKTLLANLSPLPWHQFFNEALPVTLAASAARQVVVQWPQAGQEQSNMGRCAIVDGVAMGTLLLSDFDNIVWSILVDGTPVVGLDSIQGPFGVFIYPKPVLIPMVPSQLVQIVASNLTAVAIPQVTAYLMGRSFPTDPSV